MVRLVDPTVSHQKPLVALGGSWCGALLFLTLPRDPHPDAAFPFRVCIVRALACQEGVLAGAG